MLHSRLLVDAPDAIKSSLPTMDNMKKQINDYRAKVRGRPASNPTSAQDVHIPLPDRANSTRGLFVLSDETSSNGKRIVAFTSKSCLSVLNQAHKITYIDGTFKTSLMYSSAQSILYYIICNIICFVYT